MPRAAAAGSTAVAGQQGTAPVRLLHLELRDFALIRAAQLDLADGLTVITGQSGAGKSLLFDAIAFVLGGRAHRSLLAAGAGACEVRLTLELEAALASRLGPGWQAGENLLFRSLSAAGRSRLELNGNTVKAQDLTDFAEQHFEFAGQFESRLLFDRRSHLNLVEAFGDARLQSLRADYERSYQAWADARRKLSALLESAGQRAQELDFLQFQIDELGKAAVQPGELSDVSYQLKLQRSALQLLAAAAAAARYLGGDELNSGADDLVASAEKELATVEQLLGAAEDTSSEPELLRQRAASLLEEVRELSSACQEFAASIQHDPAEERRLSERLDEILRLERKYAVGADELEVQLKARQERLDLLQDSSISVEAVEESLERHWQATVSLGQEVSKLRARAAQALVKRSMEYLKRLDFQSVSVLVEQQEQEQPGPTGVDDIELLVSLNPGEPARPLAQVVSGGEASRLLLGFKAALADRLASSVILLDEIEAGVGADAASRIAEVLQEMAQGRQLIAITHLPVVAAAGSCQLSVRKDSTSGTSSIRIVPVIGNERVQELMRMLGGQGSAEERALAQRMLSNH